MLIQRIARPPAAEYALHLSIYYCILKPQWQPGVAAGTDRQSLYGASQYYRDRHHLKGFWGHTPSRDVTWIHRDARTLAQTLWERFSSGWQSVCVSWWVFTVRMAKRSGPEIGRQRRTTWEVPGMWLKHSGRASSRLYEHCKESEMNPAKPSHKWQIRFSSSKYPSHTG